MRLRTSILTSVIAAASIAGCNRGQNGNGAGMSMPPATVTVQTAVTRDVPIYLDEIGKTVAVNSVVIMPQVAGKIIARHVDDGVYVHKGDPLFEIDPRPFEADLAAAKATQAQNQADLTWEKADFERTKELMSQNVISQLEYDQKKSAMDSGQAKVEQAEAQVKTAELNLEYTKITSPIEGRAGAVLVDPGNIVKANEGQLLTIEQLDPIYAEFTVTENELATVRKYMISHGLPISDEQTLGLKVEVDVPGDSQKTLTAMNQTPASTQPTTAPGLSHVGTLTFLDNTVQSTSGTVRLRATVPNHDHYFWPGQFVNVRLILATKKDAILVPTVAQQIGQVGPFVYVVGDDGNAVIRPITPGQPQGDLLVVNKGVEAGEKVIVSGQMLVRPGGKVNVIPSQPAAVQAGM